MNTIIAQSGGPTSVINSSLAGAISAAIENNFEKIFLSLHGIEGVIGDRVLEVDKEKFVDEKIADRLMARPSSILGSCRYKLSDDFDHEDYNKIFDTLRAHDITSFIYIGGNDSMDTVMKLNDYMAENSITGINIIGCPKTIDNDLEVMDHSPGFGSCAKFIANAARTMRTDVDVYDIKSVTFIEIMGRHAGWLAASSLAANQGLDKRAVNMVYLPEHKISLEDLKKEVYGLLDVENNLLIGIAEGFMDTDEILNDDSFSNASDGFGHKVVAGVGERLATIVRNDLGIKTRAVELNIVQRTNALISATDAKEAFELGKRALILSINQTNLIPILKRTSDDPYEVTYTKVSPDKIANLESKIPEEWLTDIDTLEKNISAYTLPLLEGEIVHEYKNGMPVFVSLSDFTI